MGRKQERNETSILVIVALTSSLVLESYSKFKKTRSQVKRRQGTRKITS